MIPLDDETLALLSKLDRFHPAEEYVFQGRVKKGGEWVRNGKRVQDASFNKVWNAACARQRIVQSTEDGEVVSHFEEDGTYVGLIPHDLRRSYVRSIDNSGVPASIGSKITGHLDAAIYEQYNKKHQSDLRSAAQKRAEYLSHTV